MTMQRDGEAAEARRGRVHFWNACTHAAGTGSRAIDCRWMISSACRNGGAALRCTPASCVCRASRGTRYGLRLQRSGASCTACGAGGAFASRRLGRPRSCLQIRWPRVMRIPDDTDHRTPGGTVVWRCAIERSWPRVAWVWLQRRGEVTVTGLQSLGSHLDVATRSREFLTAAAASWPSFSHACRRPLSPTPCLVFWLTTYRWHGSLLLSRTGTGAKPRHAEWHAFLSSHGTLLCHACLLCSALPAYWPGRWLGSRRF